MTASESRSSEGIILHTVPYRNYDQIMTVFTEDRGVIKLFCKKGASQSRRYTPLTKVEFAYRERVSELWSCEELSLLDSYLSLRNRFAHLEAGCRLIQAVYKSQGIGKEAPLLYRLLLYYLDKIPEPEDPFVLVASFKLKLLVHEGLFNLDAPGESLSEFTEQEIEHMHILAYGQSYAELCRRALSEECKSKIDTFFLQKLS